LGRAIIRRATRENWPCQFTVFSRDETKQWELRRRYPTVRCVLGDVAAGVGDLLSVMHETEPRTVIHAAAVKYIPEAEWNVWETIRINITGSTNVAIAALSTPSVEKVVGISTDKACAPLNLYGLTKAVMERAFAEANRRGKARFVTVRYGNVVGSTGSVIPVFEKQIEDHGEIRVTDPRMTRFWLSADAAVDLIILALGYAEGRPGATIIGANPAMSIVNLAAAVWQLWHLERGISPLDGFEKAGFEEFARRRAARADEPSIKFTGVRPGEKLAEQLFNAQETPRAYALFDGELTATTGFVLVPPTETLARGEGEPMPVGWPDGYSSDAPVRWLSPDEMIELIRDARTI
jgi:UDP-N-acetylglucosamine 4,6-dehydratase